VMGRIIDGGEARDWLKNSVSVSTASIDLCSAYLKLAAIEYFFDSYIGAGYECRVRVLTRWKPKDLLSGASDVEVYSFCRERRIPFYIRNDFHGKVYQIKPAGVLVGSANLTQSGFQIGTSGNEEASTIIQCGRESEAYIELLFERSTKVDDSLFGQIHSWVEDNKESKVDVLDIWPKDWLEIRLADLMPETLLVDECFHFDWGNSSQTRESQLDFAHDMSLLGGPELKIAVSHAFRELFASSRMYRWLKNILRLRGGEIYFGDLSSCLHDALIDDPRPFRKDVKIFVQNLLSWIVKVEDQQIVVDRPRHSQRIRLNH
jgi:hypothetical protein